MENETMYSGVIGWLCWFSSAQNANASDPAHREGTRLDPTKVVADVEGMARQQAAFMASEQEASGQLRNLRLKLQEHYGPRSEAPTPATTTAHSVAAANSTQ